MPVILLLPDSDLHDPQQFGLLLTHYMHWEESSIRDFFETMPFWRRVSRVPRARAQLDELEREMDQQAGDPPGRRLLNVSGVVERPSFPVHAPAPGRPITSRTWPRSLWVAMALTALM
jgi:hypothetical protein